MAAAKKRERKSTARKTSTVPTKVFTIGVNADQLPPQTRKLVHDEIFAAHLYKTRLIRINNTRKARYRRIRRTLSPRLVELEAQYDALDEQLSQLRAGLKSKGERRTSPEQRERLANIETLKIQRREVGRAITAQREVVDKTHDWKALEKQFKDAKTERLLAAARALGKNSLGPNDKGRERVVRELYDEFLASDRPREWLIKLRADRAFHRSILRARYVASNAPPAGVAKLSPGTYLDVEAAVTQALKDTIGPLKAKRFDKTGRIGAQLTEDKGLSVEKVLSGQAEWLKIEVVDGPLRKSKSDTFYPSHSRKVDLHAEERRIRAEKFAREPHLRPYRKLANIRLKLSGHVKNAAYVDMQGVLHRPLPDDGIIKWAYLNVDRLGYEFRYELQLTIESKLLSPERQRPNTGTRLGINFGWRVMPDGKIRIATTWDGARYDFIYLDRSVPLAKRSRTMLGTNRHNEALLSFADTHFNKAVTKAREWLTQLSAEEKARVTPMVVEALPRHQRAENTTLGNVTGIMSKWRDRGKLVRLVNLLQQRAGYLDGSTLAGLWASWRDSRLKEGEDLFVDEFEELRAWLEGQGVASLDACVAFYLETWRRKEIHITNGARHGAAKLKRNQTDRYRKLAYRMALGCDQVAVESWDKSKTAQVPKYEEDWRCPQEERAGAIRQFVGVSKLCMALKSQLREDLLEVPAVDITSEHFGCGGAAISQIDPDKPGLSANPMLRCSRCHTPYDQDVNAARHIWHRAFGEQSDAPVVDGTARGARSGRDRSRDQESAAE